jgi:Protein of unknown function (DUF1579)
MKRAMIAAVAAGLVCLLTQLKAQDPNALPEHKILSMEEGVWDAEIAMIVPGADSKTEPPKSTGVETNRMLAGKWLISDFKGEMFGQPFEGHGVNGYDTKKGKYVATWVDTMSKDIALLEGTYDEKTKTLTMYGDSEDPGSGKPTKMRLETQFKDDGARTFRYSVKAEGQNEFVKAMEIKYTKQKK